MLKKNIVFSFFFFLNLKLILINFFFLLLSFSLDLDSGKKIFSSNCNVCHSGGNNIIIPEKNFKKQTLELNGMNDLNSIIYQIINGKNGMPAFGGRLKEQQIREVAHYVIEQIEK